MTNIQQKIIEMGKVPFTFIYGAVGENSNFKQKVVFTIIILIITFIIVQLLNYIYIKIIEYKNAHRWILEGTKSAKKRLIIYQDSAKDNSSTITSVYI